MVRGEDCRTKSVTQLCPKGLLDNVYREVHIAVSGTTEVIADSNEPPGLLWRDGNLGNSSGFDNRLDLQFLQVEPVSDVFGAERRPPGRGRSGEKTRS